MILAVAVWFAIGLMIGGLIGHHMINRKIAMKNRMLSKLLMGQTNSRTNYRNLLFVIRENLLHDPLLQQWDGKTAMVAEIDRIIPIRPPSEGTLQ